MYCPSCGTEDNNANIYCRSCGSDLRVVRKALSSPGLFTGQASAREEIARAFADRIRAAHPGDLNKITEEVLPEVEKFLESPEEKRLRRLRTGSVLSLIGLGALIGFLLLAIFTGEKGFGFLAAGGMTVLFLGLAFITNGYFLSVPKRGGKDEEATRDQREGIGSEKAELLMPANARDEFVGSVTEGTTRNLEFQKTADGRRETEDEV